MKRFIFLVFIFFQSNTIRSQEANTLSDKNNVEEIQFELIDEIPVFPGCEEKDKKETFKCFEIKLREHIIKYFRYPKKALKTIFKVKSLCLI